MKELLEASVSLSSEEIRDVAIAEKELGSGKCKTFKTADDMIADLHRKTKEAKMAKKCDVKGCKRKAEYVFPDKSLCFIHFKELEREAQK